MGQQKRLSKTASNLNRKVGIKTGFCVLAILATVLVIFIEKLEFVLLVFVWFFLKRVFLKNRLNENFKKKSFNVEN
jgi:hypothetical protein